MPFKSLAKKLTPNNFNKMIKSTFDNQFVKDAYLDILQKRLYYEGEDANNKFLITNKSREQKNTYPYARNTVNGTTKYKGKIDKNQPYNRVTLSDTGKFYDSFVLKALNKSILVSAKYNKKDGNIYENFTSIYNTFSKFDEAITGLQENEWDIYLNQVFMPTFLQIFQNNLSSV